MNYYYSCNTANGETFAGVASSVLTGVDCNGNTVISTEGVLFIRDWVAEENSLPSDDVIITFLMPIA